MSLTVAKQKEVVVRDGYRLFSFLGTAKRVPVKSLPCRGLASLVGGLTEALV